MEQRVNVRRIELVDGGRLAITLGADPSDVARYIYRAAAEIAWEAQRMRFISPRPELGPPSTHFVHVAFHARNELGYRLMTTVDTEWVGVPSPERISIEAYTANART